MKEIKVLDCTLRDGGRVIECEFGENSISNILNKLVQAQVDIIEVGFLRSGISYSVGSTFFTTIDQIKPYLPKNSNSLFVAFTDIGMFEYESLPKCDKTSITGIRVGFKKGELEQAILACKILKEKGYIVFVQSVDSLGYSIEEISHIIEQVNAISPYSFGIVDTYGSMDMDDFLEIYDLVVSKLSKDIMIDFHSHNNYQMSFSLAQQIIKKSQSSRNIIIDCTLYGMGKAAGNLNTELIIDYLHRKKNKTYNIDKIFDVIDEEILPIYCNNYWGHSLPSLFAGIYSSHPNNLSYLTKKFKLDSKDIKNILSSIPSDKRKTYDYDFIDSLYIQYSSVSVDDTIARNNLAQIFNNQNVLLVAPGKSIEDYQDKINNYISEKNAIVVNLNFLSGFFNKNKNAFVFFNSKKKYETFYPVPSIYQTVLFSNVSTDETDKYIINYSSVVKRECTHFDNVAIMTMRLLQTFNIASLAIAGFDGFSENNDFAENIKVNKPRYKYNAKEINNDILFMLKNFVESINNKFEFSFITPTMFKKALKSEVEKLDLKLMIFDIDGTLTDGKICISADGEIFKSFNVKDGYGIVQLRNNGVEPMILTGRTSEITLQRSKELGITKVFTGVLNKAEFLDKYLSENGLSWENVGYMGDDIIDLECMKKSSFSACPNDALNAIKDISDFVSEYNGGNGAARQVCDYIIENYC